MSLFEQFAAHRDKVLGEQTRDLPVPRYTAPRVLVRIRPLEDDAYAAALRRVGSTAKDRIDHSANVVSQACIGVFLQDLNSGVIEPACADEGDPPTFADGRVAPLVGAETGEPIQLVRALFVTDADVAAASEAVLEFSGYGRRIALEAVVGESPATP